MISDFSGGLISGTSERIALDLMKVYEQILPYLSASLDL
jgi:hypothetical protein